MSVYLRINVVFWRRKEGGQRRERSCQLNKTLFDHIKILENCSGKAGSRKQILEIWQKFEKERELRPCWKSCTAFCVIASTATNLAILVSIYSIKKGSASHNLHIFCSVQNIWLLSQTLADKAFIYLSVFRGTYFYGSTVKYSVYSLQKLFWFTSQGHVTLSLIPAAWSII